MTAPSPVLPSFFDGTPVHQADLNALVANIQNLYNFNQGGFRTQRPCVIAKATSSQTIPATTDRLVNFQSAAVNTNNMWVPSVAYQVQVQTPGIYWVFSQTRWPPSTGAAVSSSILVNGTSPANAQGTQLLSAVNTGAGPATQNGLLADLAAGATLYLNAWHDTGADRSLPTNFGSSYLGAIFLTPSS